MTDVKPAMLAALSHLPACTALSFAREEKSLPIIVIGDESGRTFAQADGQEYLAEYVAAVDIYAADQGELEGLFRETDSALSALGLRRTGCQDLYDEQAYAYRKRLRYRALLQGDLIYQ